MSNNRNGRVIDSALRKKGFARSVEFDHVVYRMFNPQGELVSRTKMSHGVMGISIGPPLISLMARQLRLTKAQFLDFIDCTISETDYRTILH